MIPAQPHIVQTQAAGGGDSGPPPRAAKRARWGEIADRTRRTLALSTKQRVARSALMPASTCPHAPASSRAHVSTIARCGVAFGHVEAGSSSWLPPPSSGRRLFGAHGSERCGGSPTRFPQRAITFRARGPERRRAPRTSPAPKPCPACWGRIADRTRGTLDTSPNRSGRGRITNILKPRPLASVSFPTQLVQSVELDPPVLGPAGRRRVAGHRIGLPVALGDQARRIDTCVHQILLHGIGSPL